MHMDDGLIMYFGIRFTIVVVVPEGITAGPTFPSIVWSGRLCGLSPMESVLLIFCVIPFAGITFLTPPLDSHNRHLF